MIDFDPTVSFSLILSVAAMLFAWFRTRRQDIDTKLADVGTRLTAGARRMDALDARVAATESGLQAMPGQGEVHRLELHMAQMAGDLRVVSQRLQGNHEMLTRIESVVSRHEDHLRDSGNV